MYPSMAPAIVLPSAPVMVQSVQPVAVQKVVVQPTEHPLPNQVNPPPYHG